MTRLFSIGIVVCFVGIVLLSGCTYPAISHHEIDFDGTVERVDGTFRMDGQVEVDIGTAPPQNFSDVAVVLYDSNRSAITEVPLGPMSTNSSISPSRKSVNITSDTQPTFVVVESPDFWQDDLQTIAYHWTGDRYDRYFIGSDEEKFRPEDN